MCLEAKLDTGAATSSLHARDVKQFTRNGAEWLRFTLQTSGTAPAVIEAPVVRKARIRRADTGISERPVIALDICLAGRTGTAEFTLTDRTEMKYSVLIGREFLSGRIYVDAGRTFAAAGKCTEPPAQ